MSHVTFVARSRRETSRAGDKRAREETGETNRTRRNLLADSDRNNSYTFD